MNLVCLTGRLTKDVDVRTSQAGKSVARFTIAVNRRFKNKEGGYDADFISCIAFGNQADFIAKYFSKGSQIGITGSIQTGSYEGKDGNRVYTTDVLVDAVEFGGAKPKENTASIPAEDLFADELEEFTDDVQIPF